MSEQNQRAEALFETLSKNKKLRRRRIIRTVLITIAVIAAILITTVILLTKKVEKRFAAAAAEVQSYQVTTGTIHTIVSGTGVLTESDEATTLQERDTLRFAGDRPWTLANRSNGSVRAHVLWQYRKREGMV
jgi:hypothetical protein